MCQHVYIYIMCMLGVLKDQKKVLDLLELGLEIVVNYLIWVLEIELEFSATACTVLYCHVISPAPSLFFKTYFESVSHSVA